MMSTRRLDDDKEILRLIGNGNESAFKSLYERHKDKIYNAALSYLKDASDAEEITQDVFLEAYHGARSFEHKSSVLTWLYRIAINKSLDRIRFRQRKKRFGFIHRLFSEDSNMEIYEPPDFVHPGVVLENKENARLLFKAIDQLPEQQKTAFLLTFVEGLPGNEVAEIMKISLKAVESLKQRAKTTLRNLLEEFYPERRK